MSKTRATAHLFQRDALLQPAPGEEHGMIGAVLPARIGASAHDREPGVDCMRRIHLARHNADNGGWLAVKIDHASNNLGIAVKGAVPKTIAENDQGRRARLIFIFSEGPANLRRQSDYVEEVRRYKRNRDSFRFAAGNAAEIARLQTAEREMLERSAVAPPVDVIRQSDRHIRSGGGLIKINDALRLRIRERTEEDGVNHAEDRAVRTDAERQREHSDDCEARGFAQLAEGEAEIVHYLGFRFSGC